MKTFHAFFSVVSILLLLDHLVSVSLLMSGLTPYNANVILSGAALFFWLVIHGCIGAYYYVKGKRGRTEEHRTYPKHSRTLLIQRLSGFLALALVVIHISGETNALSSYSFCHSPSLPAFLCMAALLILICVHVAIGLPKGMLALGLTRWKHSYTVWQAVGIALGVIPCVLVLRIMYHYWQIGGLWT